MSNFEKISIANVKDKNKIIKKVEALISCTPVTYIDCNLQLTPVESSEILRELFKSAELNVSDKNKITKKDEVLASSAPVTYIDRNLQLSPVESSEALKEELFKSAELNEHQRSAAENLVTQFQDYFSKHQKILAGLK